MSLCETKMRTISSEGRRPSGAFVDDERDLADVVTVEVGDEEYASRQVRGAGDASGDPARGQQDGAR